MSRSIRSLLGAIFVALSLVHAAPLRNGLLGALGPDHPDISFFDSTTGQVKGLSDTAKLVSGSTHGGTVDMKAGVYYFPSRQGELVGLSLRNGTVRPKKIPLHPTFPSERRVNFVTNWDASLNEMVVSIILANPLELMFGKMNLSSPRPQWNPYRSFAGVGAQFEHLEWKTQVLDAQGHRLFFRAIYLDKFGRPSVNWTAMDLRNNSAPVMSFARPREVESEANWEPLTYVADTGSLLMFHVDTRYQEYILGRWRPGASRFTGTLVKGLPPMRTHDGWNCLGYNDRTKEAWLFLINTGVDLAKRLFLVDTVKNEVVNSWNVFRLFDYFPAATVAI